MSRGLDNQSATIIELPVRATATGTAVGAGRIDIWKWRLRQAIGNYLNALAIPGAIRPIEIADAVTGQQVAVFVGSLFVRLSVNGRDYYFDRLTGRFAGTGSGCDCG